MTTFNDCIKNAAMVVRVVVVSVGIFTSTQVSAANHSMSGNASWYALHSRTASGQMMNPNRMTAAHKSLPFGSIVQVTMTKTGRSVVVCINDRGPFVRGRVIDLSKAAAKQLGMINQGSTQVSLRKIGKRKSC